MSGSRLGRGRGGRLAAYGGVLIIFVIIVYLYRVASMEMARLHELHVQCAHQQEALAAQLQVIYEYKVRLENSLQDEKNSNQALKQELQQRASKEKTLRDKDNIEIVQRYNAVQQKYSLLQSENKDLQEECNKRQKLALEETNRLEVTLKELRGQISRAQEDKRKALENLKSRNLELDFNFQNLDNKYSSLVKNTAKTNSTILHLEKKVFQLERELEEAKKSPTSFDYNIINPGAPVQPHETIQEKSRAHSVNEQVARPSQHQQQQVSHPSNGDDNPLPLPAPRDHQPIGVTLNENNDDRLPNEQNSDVGFAQRDGNIVPVGPNDLKDQQNNLPLPMSFKSEAEETRKNEKGTENVGEEPPKPEVLNQGSAVLRKPNEKSSSNGPKLAPIQPQRKDKATHSDNRGHLESPQEVDELQNLRDKVNGILGGAH